MFIDSVYRICKQRLVCNLFRQHTCPHKKETINIEIAFFVAISINIRL